ncbi:MAG TPA: circularly permuted type 2 ATP-grasp protein [Thermoleophilaceae bacterium]|nr:circularly permuted type 2 ATP-grasp protein [Thermoleophilaceae bacterium]
MSRPYDEAYDEDGRPRSHYAELLEGLSEPGRLAATVKDRVRASGITFGASPDGYFNLDPVPRILPEEEWSELQIGIAQRLRALDAFVADVYGDGRIVEAGVVPRHAVESAAHYEPAMVGALPPGRWVAIAGLDVVRCEDGRWRVIEDQVRMPSGLAYAVGARETMRALLPVNPPLGDLSVGFGELAQALHDAAPAGVDEPSAVVLCEGPKGGGWWEHERLSRELGAPAVTLADLEHRSGRLVAWLDGRQRAVDVVLHRTDDDRFTDEKGRPTAVGEALLGPCSEGRLACVNAPGAGVSDDKLVHAYVEEMVRFYLGEEPLLPSVRSYDLGDERQLAEALERLDELVIKPRGEMGGEGVVIWRDADQPTRERVREALQSDPTAHVAQELVALSVHPTVCDGRLESRHVDLRPYALLSDEGVRILPGGLSRVALERGSLVVNSGQGGGAKDTWVPA